jgi:hypothetical protein
MANVVVRDPVTGQLSTALDGFSFSSLKLVGDDGYEAARNEIVRCDTGGGAFTIDAPSAPVLGDMFGVIYETPTGLDYNRLSVGGGNDYADFFGGTAGGGLVTLQGESFIIFKLNAASQWQPLHLGGLSDRKNFAEATFDKDTADATPLTVFTYEALGEEEIRWKVLATARIAGGDMALFHIDAVFTHIGGSLVERFVHYVVDDRAPSLASPKVDVDFDLSGSDINLQLTGQAATSIQWTIDLYVQCNPIPA